MTEPTDAEIRGLAATGNGVYQDDETEITDPSLLKLVHAALAKLGQPAQAAEPVAWLRNTTDPQPHAVTNLKYRGVVNVTPLEPEWEGHITLEFSNTTPLPARIYANEGVAQFLFFQADPDDICETSYLDRGGKYQGQTGVTLPRT